MPLDEARLPGPVKNFDRRLRGQWFAAFSHKLRKEAVYYGRKQSQFSRIVTRLALPNSNQDKMFAAEIMQVHPDEYLSHEYDALTTFSVGVRDPPDDDHPPWNPNDPNSMDTEVTMPDLDQKNYRLHLLAFVDERPAGLMAVVISMQRPPDTVRLYIQMVVVSPLFRGIGLVRHLLEAYDELLVEKVQIDYNVVSEFITKPYNVTTGLHIAAEKRGFETYDDVKAYDEYEHPCTYMRMLKKGQQPPPSGTQGIIGFSSTIGQPVCAECREPSNHPAYRPESSKIYNEVPWIIDPDTLTHVFLRGAQGRGGRRKDDLYLCQDCVKDPSVTVKYEIDRRDRRASQEAIKAVLQNSGVFDSGGVIDESVEDKNASLYHAIYNPGHLDAIKGASRRLQKMVAIEPDHDELTRCLKDLVVGQEHWDDVKERLVACKRAVDALLLQETVLFSFTRNGYTKERNLCVKWRPLCKFDYIQLRVFVSTAIHRQNSTYTRSGEMGLSTERLYDACEKDVAVGCFVHDRLSVVCVTRDEDAPDPHDVLHWNSGNIPEVNLPYLEGTCSQVMVAWRDSRKDTMAAT